MSGPYATVRTFTLVTAGGQRLPAVLAVAPDLTQDQVSSGTLVLRPDGTYTARARVGHYQRGLPGTVISWEAVADGRYTRRGDVIALAGAGGVESTFAAVDGGRELHGPGVPRADSIMARVTSATYRE